jgi:hypothetical protein
MKGKTLVIYFTEDKKCRQIIKLSDTFEGSPKDVVHDISKGTYHSFEVL